MPRVLPPAHVGASSCSEAAGERNAGVGEAPAARGEYGPAAAGEGGGRAASAGSGRWRQGVGVWNAVSFPGKPRSPAVVPERVFGDGAWGFRASLP